MRASGGGRTPSAGWVLEAPQARSLDRALAALFLPPAGQSDAHQRVGSSANRARRRYDAARMRLSSILLAAVALLQLAGCGTGSGSCSTGALCECSGGTDCYQGCADSDGCDLLCHDMVHCGGVCGDGCGLTCHDVNDCSASCGDHCNIDCHNTVSCGAFCGANCQYDCHDVDRCGVRAGAGSVIRCTSVTTCAVECSGACQVVCTDTQSCDLTCSQGLPPSSCADGTVRCGSC